MTLVIAVLKSLSMASLNIVILLGGWVRSIPSARAVSPGDGVVETPVLTLGLHQFTNLLDSLNCRRVRLDDIVQRRLCERCGEFLLLTG